MKFHFSLAIFALSLFLCASGGTRAFAADTMAGGAFAARPANPRADNPRSSSIFIYKQEPETQFKDGILLTNRTDQSRSVRVYAVDSQASSGGAFACAQEIEPRVSVGSWIALEAEKVTLGPSESKVVPFTLTVPSNASVGEQDGCMVIQDDTEKQATGNGIVLSFRSAIRIAVEVPGTIVKRLTALASTAAITADKVAVVPSFRNEGNVSIDATLKLQLNNFFGQAASETGGVYPVLPKTSTTWNLELPRPFWGGFYRLTSTAAYNNDPTLSLGQGTNTASVSAADLTLWVRPQPVAILAYAAIALFTVFLALFLVFRNFYGRTVKTKWKDYKVKQGDSLVHIAEAYGVGWKKLAKANGLKAPYVLNPGKVLRVPPPK